MKKMKTKQQANCYLMYYYHKKTKQSTYKTPLQDTVFIHIDVKWVVEFQS